MEDSRQIDGLVEQFRRFLEQAGDGAAGTETGDTVDLFTLFTELSALKNEVKLESRHVKEALNQFGDLFETLRENNHQLSRELEQRQKTRAEHESSAQRPLLLEIIDLKDRLEATLLSLGNYRPAWLERRSTRTTDFHQSLREGL